VLVIGQGHVGLSLAVAASSVPDWVVIGYDVDVDRVRSLAGGRTSGLNVDAALLTPALRSGRYSPTSDPTACGDFDVAVICVPTRLKDGLPDNSPIASAADLLAPYLRPRSTVVLESTTTPGTTQEVLGRGLSEKCDLTVGVDLFIGYSPERVDPGSSSWPLTSIPKLIAADDPASLHAVRAFYESFVLNIVEVAGTREAELSKLFENVFRAVNIAMVNELASVARRLGVNLPAVLRAAATKPFGFMSFAAGPGVGGHCIPVDPVLYLEYVKGTTGTVLPVAAAATHVNATQPERVASRCRELAYLGAERDAECDVLILGISYKPDVGDTRQSPSLKIARLLLSSGLTVHYCDALANDPGLDGLVRRPFRPDVLSSARLVALLVPHAHLRREIIVRSSRRILDVTGTLVLAPKVEYL
jgi:UDP-N-acetyl-D-glucosamine dehydrogenase